MDEGHAEVEVEPEEEDAESNKQTMLLSATILYYMCQMHMETRGTFPGTLAVLRLIQDGGGAAPTSARHRRRKDTATASKTVKKSKKKKIKASDILQ